MLRFGRFLRNTGERPVQRGGGFFQTDDVEQGGGGGQKVCFC